MINFPSQVFPQQILGCSDRQSRKENIHLATFTRTGVALVSMALLDGSNGKLVRGSMSANRHRT